MKSQKGITLTSLIIYVIVVIIVTGILAVITTTYRKNISEMNKKGTSGSEIDKFNMYFLREVKTQGNEVSSISESKNEIEFTLGNKYTFKDNCIYLNDDIVISVNIEKCEFSNSLVNGKKIIKVTIKGAGEDERVIEYTLGDETQNVYYESESDYIDKNSKVDNTVESQSETENN